MLLYSVPFSSPHRVLIVDWDVHHGQGTQFTFDQDPRYAPSITPDARGPVRRGPGGKGRHAHSLGIPGIEFCAVLSESAFLISL